MSLSETVYVKISRVSIRNITIKITNKFNTNPDGIAVGSRNNANNVNLGRNFPTANWKADIDTASGILKNGGGKKAGSEPETKALINLTRQLRPRVQISFHAQGSLVGANK